MKDFGFYGLAIPAPRAARVSTLCYAGLGYGYSTETKVEGYFREFPLTILSEGTNVVQRDVNVWRQIMRRRVAT